MAGLTPGRDGRIGRYLRPNDRVWTPPCLITFDTETRRHQRGDGEDQQLRLWCAALDDRRQQHHAPYEHAEAQGHTGAELAAQVDTWMRGRQVAWIYAHNLGYDLTTSALVEHLAALGWVVDTCSSIPEYLFLTMSKGRHRVTLTDLHHLLPMRLADVGTMLGRDKLRMPPEAAPDADWFTYCGRDVSVLATCLLVLMGHWDDYGLGNWSLSGAACGFRAMRHTLPAKAVTLIEDPAGSANDRAAIYGGRRYCWRHGELPPGRYSELDFTSAHASTMATHPMPVKRGGWFDSLPPDHMAIDGKFALVIAECEVETDRPRFPCRAGGRVWYPVGRFRTVLASPEIAWARDTGCLRAIGRGQFHYTSGVYRPFFRRVLETSDPRSETYPPVVRAMWKQWGRSVVGKFAQRGYVTEDTGLLTDRTWHYERAMDAASGEAYWLIHYGGTIKRTRQQGDGTSAYPAILAMVESYERVALGKAAELLGDRVVIQCDTDGLWANMGELEAGAVTGLGFRLADVAREARIGLAVDVVNNALTGLQLREKHTVSRMVVLGPQNYTAGNYTRQSGRPKGLREVRPGIWAGDTFPSIARQMAASSPEVYRTESVTWQPPASAVPGWVLADGTVRPVEVAQNAAGAWEVRPWLDTAQNGAGGDLGPVQHKALDGLWAYVDRTPEAGPEPMTEAAGLPAEDSNAEGELRQHPRPPRPLRSAFRQAEREWRAHRKLCYDCRRGQNDTSRWCDIGFRLAQQLHQAREAMNAPPGRPLI